MRVQQWRFGTDELSFVVTENRWVLTFLMRDWEFDMRSRSQQTRRVFLRAWVMEVETSNPGLMIIHLHNSHISRTADFEAYGSEPSDLVWAGDLKE